MIKRHYLVFLIALLNFKDVLNQNDYLYEEQYEGSPQMYASSGESQFSAGKPRYTLTVGAAEGAMNLVGGILSLGNCMIKCVFGFMKSCGAVITCPWNCLFPNQPIARSLSPPPKDDDDIELYDSPNSRIQRQNSLFLTPSEVVELAKCLAQCLIRYLPRSPSTMSDYLYCSVKQCLCG